MFYFAKTPWLLKKMYPAAIWGMPDREKVIYLTFDDGPHPEITPFVLNELKKFNAKATFFCIGNNVVKYRDIYTNIIDDGHKIGNHTYNHLNGWKTDDKKYFTDIAEARKYIDADLFRPPYGRISKLQLKYLTESFNMKVIMWSVLSGDFDQKITPEACLKNVVLSTKSGSIIVFHDSEKAFKNMQYALPRTLEYFEKQGYRFDKINL
ncbi:polysaccharide deacetylase family protein [Terrimonas sp.]|uniref:polysaccharide deacetylase family protein n=1 Tax=Terrimonas sp. TaxID=1914338 RepID=UPI000D524D62|nr:polysaccharide deacetylase family protein [Terrimonas sp.]PVD49596.1 polysaccharide deacetylase family protein [Terrimonas sp.]